MAYVLIGFMGAGKSSAAAELASALATAVLDSDRRLEARFGRTVAEQFERDGEAAFREVEEHLVCELLDRAEPREVVALGGGSVLSARVQAALERHVTILLDVAPERCWGRVGEGTQGARRPLARDRERFIALHGERAELYGRLADAILVEPVRGSIARAAGALGKLAGAPGGTRLLWATAASRDYPVFVARGLLGPAGGEALERLWPLDRSRSRPFVVTDEHVAARYGQRLGALAGSIAIAPGEQHKTLASAEQAWEAMLAAGLTRADHVAALGGGVVGDLAGFCAATYQRGVAVVQLPTTLVAQVDSAYGGKTGIDLPAAKNYVGAYHQPAGVLVDPDTLLTLPAAELAAGWVEVLKTALIAGGWLWHALDAGAPVDDRVIVACARTKLAVVAADERDAGARQVLNLGHTVGHAIEASTGYRRYRHGEAVGLGLLAALRLSGQDELRARVRSLLHDHGLPVTLEDAPAERVLEAITRDKKRVGPEVPFVLLSAPGDVTHGSAVPAADLRAAVVELEQAREPTPAPSAEGAAR